jgi:hypothetical protein
MIQPHKGYQVIRVISVQDKSHGKLAIFMV